MGGIFYGEVEETRFSLAGLWGCGSRVYSGFGEGRTRWVEWGAGWEITAPVLLMNEVWGCRVGRDILR